MDIQKRRFFDLITLQSKNRPQAPRTVEEAREQKEALQGRSDSAILLSRGKRQTHFYTEDSRLYITPKEQWHFSRGYERQEQSMFDGARSRYVRKQGYVVQKQIYETELYRQYWKFRRSFFGLRSYIVSLPDDLAVRVSPVKVWNFSIISAIIFGMVSMSFIYRYLGQGAMAKDQLANSVQIPSIEKQIEEVAPIVLGDDVIEGDELDPVLPIAEPAETPEMIAQREFEETAREMVKGYPIEKMLPYIFEQERIVAAYLIAVAKKESAWGKRVPVYKGEDCFNYWGYRGKRKIMGSGGHTCFDGPRDAVETVGERIKWFVKQKGYDTPEKLVVWKCGSTCAGHSPTSVNKWISDVDMYFSKLYK